MPPPKPWYHPLTLDLLTHVLQNSLFHPFVASLLPICLRALSAPYSSPEFRLACAYAVLINILWLLAPLNRRLAYGAPRELDWDAEVVVITGGASGLGKVLAEMFGMRGASVAVLDVREPGKESEGLAGVKTYLCDVGDAEAVERVKGEIEKDLGVPTILINNAGIAHRKPLLQLSASEVTKTFQVNTLSHFHTLHTFLPGMLASPTGGTIITLSSVLGKLGASHLSDYTASKAALLALHSSLRAELSSPSAPGGAENIRTILVTPGQLSTSLFAGVATPNDFFGPVVEPVELAKEIVRMIDAGESGEISLPLYARWIEWLAVLPVGLQRVIRGLAGVDRAMEGFGAAKPATPAAPDPRDPTTAEAG